MKIGPSFASELAAAGLVDLPISWDEAGNVTGREALTQAEDAILDQVLAAHDPMAEGAAPSLARAPDRRSRLAACRAAIAEANDLAALRAALLHLVEELDT